MRRSLRLAWCAAVLSVGCGHTHGSDDHHHDTGDEAVGAPTGATCSTDSRLTYNTFGESFFAEYCVSCHGANVVGDDRMGAPPDHDFETREGVLDELDHVADTAAGGPKAINRSMPPAGSRVPSDAERKLLGEWIACGAP